jgi:hypothetical protein
MFVRQRVERPAAALLHFLSKLDHLINRLPAIEPHDELFDVARQRRIVFRRPGVLEDPNHHGDHDLRPAFADQRQRAVEIK